MEKRKISLACALLFASLSANAALVTITNASFETNALADAGFDSNVPGWVVSGDAGRFNPNGQLSPEAWDGVMTAYANVGSLTQTLGTSVVAGTTYTLSLYVGDRSDLPFPGFTVDLLDGGAAVAGNLTGTAPVDGEWSLYNYSFTAAADGGALGIRLASNGAQTNFDALSLNAVAAVPEPETYAMFLAGLGLLSVASRKRKV